jgi:LacI family transcriptional regulator
MAARSRRVTLRDLAAETGLSQSAVSYALRGLRVPEETQQRVQEAADRLGYQADPIARALASGRTGTVGLLCESLDDLWQQSVAAAVGAALLRTGISTLIVDVANDPETERSEARRLVDQRVDVLITIPAAPGAEHWREVADTVPVISLGDALPHASTAAEIVFDNDLGVREGLTQFATMGHRRVAFLTPNLDATPDRPAEQVVRSLGRELGLEVAVVPTPFGLDAASVVVQELLRRDPRPTAFFCLADSIAHGVYDAAREVGLEIPGDLSVIGYDDRPVSRLLNPPLTTFRWPLDDIVRSLVEQVRLAVEEGTRGVRTVHVATRMVRGSVQAAP